MYRLKDIYPKNIVLTLYNSLVVPHLNYCILTWGSKIVNGHKIHILQKKALRIITDSDYIAHSEPICKEICLIIIIINNNNLKSNIQCIEIRVQWTVHLGSSHMHVHAVTRVHAVTPKLVICVMYLTSI